MATQTHVRLVWPGETYDPQRHITAKELRALGAAIPDHVPDCAWVPRGGAPPFTVTVENHPEKAGVLRGTITMGLADAFQWMESNVTIEGDVDLGDLVPGGPDGLP